LDSLVYDKQALYLLFFWLMGTISRACSASRETATITVDLVPGGANLVELTLLGSKSKPEA